MPITDPDEIRRNAERIARASAKAGGRDPDDASPMQEPWETDEEFEARLTKWEQETPDPYGDADLADQPTALDEFERPPRDRRQSPVEEGEADQGATSSDPSDAPGDE